MSHGNGNGPIVQFPKHLPIIGQLFTLKNFFVTVQIQCNCEAKEPVLLVGNGLSQCPACKRIFQMQGIQPGANGQLSFAIGLVVPQQPVIPEAGGATS